MQDLMIFFAQTYEFVEKGKEKGSVLIHWYYYIFFEFCSLNNF